MQCLRQNKEGRYGKVCCRGCCKRNSRRSSFKATSTTLVGGTWINYTKDRATLFTTDDSMIYDPPLAAQRFELMEILRRGK